MQAQHQHISAIWLASEHDKFSCFICQSLPTAASSFIWQPGIKDVELHKQASRCTKEGDRERLCKRMQLAQLCNMTFNRLPVPSEIQSGWLGLIYSILWIHFSENPFLPQFRLLKPVASNLPSVNHFGALRLSHMPNVTRLTKQQKLLEISDSLKFTGAAHQ